MIFIDYNNISSIQYSMVLKTVLEDEKKVFKKAKIVDVEKEKYNIIFKAFLKVMLNTIKSYKNQLIDYGDICICCDYNSSTYWRKKLFPEYKLNRLKPKSNEFDEVTWSNFNNHKKFIMHIFKALGVKTIAEVETKWEDGTTVSLEADEIIAVASQQIGKNVIVSSDKDFYQLLLHNDNIKIYNPIMSKIIKITKGEIKRINILACLCGQAKDNIKSIHYQSKFNNTFVNWMKDKHNLDITEEMIDNFRNNNKKYAIYMNEFVNEMKEEDKILLKEGKIKIKRNLTPFNKKGLGVAGAKKLLEDYSIEEILNVDKHYTDIYNLNKKLYSLTNLPKCIYEAVMERYNNLESEKDLNKINELVKILKLGMIEAYELKNYINS